MNKSEQLSFTRLLGSTTRALAGYIKDSEELSGDEKRAAALLFRKSIAEENAVTLGSIATQVNNALQGIEATIEKAKNGIIASKGKGERGFYSFGNNCDEERAWERIRSLCTDFQELYGQLKMQEASGIPRGSLAGTR